MSDFDYEFQMAFTNRKLNDEAETIFLMPSVEFTYLNSSMVKQLVKHGAMCAPSYPSTSASG